MPKPQPVPDFLCLDMDSRIFYCRKILCSVFYQLPSSPCLAENLSLRILWQIADFGLACRGANIGEGIWGQVLLSLDSQLTSVAAFKACLSSTPQPSATLVTSAPSKSRGFDSTQTCRMWHRQLNPAKEDLGLFSLLKRSCNPFKVLPRYFGIKLTHFWSSRWGNVLLTSIVLF